MLKQKVIGSKLEARNHRMGWGRKDQDYKSELYKLKYEKCKSIT